MAARLPIRRRGRGGCRHRGSGGRAGGGRHRRLCQLEMDASQTAQTAQTAQPRQPRQPRRPRRPRPTSPPNVTPPPAMRFRRRNDRKLDCAPPLYSPWRPPWPRPRPWPSQAYAICQYPNLQPRPCLAYASCFPLASSAPPPWPLRAPLVPPPSPGDWRSPLSSASARARRATDDRRPPPPQ